MNTKTLTLTVLLAALILTPLAIAAPDGAPRERGGRGGFGGGRGGMGNILNGRMAEELELTEAQKEKIKAITEKNREAAQTTRQAVRETMQALNDAVDGGDEATITTAGKAVGDAMTKQALLRAATSKSIKAELTEEQRAKFKELRAEMRERMQQMRQNRSERGEGRPRRGGRNGERRGPGQDDDN